MSLNNSVNKVFDNSDLKHIIFSYYPSRCKSCHSIMHRKFVDSSFHFYKDDIWRATENEFCKGYCNWCCIYVFEHSR